MALEQYAVRLTSDEREQLSQLIRSGKSSARIIARARILLKVAEGWTAPQVAAALDVSKGTVYRAKRRYAEEGLAGVIQAGLCTKIRYVAEPAHFVLWLAY